VGKTCIAMLDKDRHIHLIPAERVLMLTIEHANLKKAEGERYEVECVLKLSVEGFPHPLEDVIRFTFASARKHDLELMTEIVMVQNHIIKFIFDTGLYGDRGICPVDDPSWKECGVTISSDIKQQMLASRLLKDVLEKHGAMPESIAFPK
jgi:hypothetical protein